MKKVINGFEKYSDANLELMANTIYNALIGNPRFPAPDPAMPAFREGIDNYGEALLLAQVGDRTLIAIKNEERGKLIDQLHRLGAYVMFASKGDDVALQSSGFPLSKVRQPKPPLQKPVGFQLAAGINPGELLALVDRVANARSYQFEYAAEPMLPNALWQLRTSTSRKTLLSGLESGKRYRCRVGAVGVGNQLAYSDEVSCVVQ